MIVYIFFIMIIHYLEMFIPFFILYNYKYRKSAVHHERHTALFSVNRTRFNIYSPPCLSFVAAWGGVCSALACRIAP